MALPAHALQQFLRRVQTPAPEFALDDSAIGRLLDHCHRRRFPNRTDIFRPGDLADTMYYVISGSLSILTRDAQSEEQHELVLGYINAGEFVGEAGVFVPMPQREVTLRTRMVSELAEISYERLFALLNGPLADICPQLLFALGSQLTRRLLLSNRRINRLAFMDVTTRISSALDELCQEPDAAEDPQGMRIKVSRQELARIVGCSREMAGRVLRRLEEQGKVKAYGKTVIVFSDPSASRPHDEDAWLSSSPSQASAVRPSLVRSLS